MIYDKHIEDQFNYYEGNKLKSRKFLKYSKSNMNRKVKEDFIMSGRNKKRRINGKMYYVNEWVFVRN